jgi:hypothetical protein
MSAQVSIRRDLLHLGWEALQRPFMDVQRLWLILLHCAADNFLMHLLRDLLTSGLGTHKN